MAHLIDKDALVAKIEKLIPSEPFPKTSETLYGAEVYGKREICFKILDLIDTLEVKEVNLESEIKKIQKEYKTIDEYDGYPATIYASNIEWIAKHFFELGLKAKQG